jgi:hypothetical protein
MKITSLVLCICCLFTTLSFGQKPKKKVPKRVKKVKVIVKPIVVVEPEMRAENPQQGICGTIVWKSGNMMPSPDREMPKPKPVQRELFIYDLTDTAQATLKDGFYQAMVTSLIKTVKSDAEGKFCVELPEGKYSLFVKEGDKGWYANQFDGEGNIFPVKVGKDKLSIVVFTIDYQATY